MSKDQELAALRSKLRRLEKNPLTRGTMLAAATAARISELQRQKG